MIYFSPKTQEWIYTSYDMTLTAKSEEELMKAMEEKWIAKMTEAIDNWSKRKGHERCDDVLCEFLKELGFTRLVEVYDKQDKWYA